VFSNETLKKSRITHLFSGVNMNKHQTTADGLQILYQRYYANNPERQLELEKARIDDEVARKIFKIKETHHLSTKALAELINTDEFIIEALENADYEGNSFLLLNLIATALKIKVKFELVSV
jgi:ribosome-binding protein aMBF1 (putative translation factor)